MVYKGYYLPTPEPTPLTVESDINQPETLKAPDVTESGNANIPANTSDGFSLKIERPEIRGYKPELDEKGGYNHQFPKYFDKQIVKEGIGTYESTFHDPCITYRAPDTITYINGINNEITKNGAYEVTVRLSDGYVVHRFFNPNYVW